MHPFGIRLGVFWALFVASVLMFVRNRAAVFFSLFLPLIIMLVMVAVAAVAAAGLYVSGVIKI